MDTFTIIVNRLSKTLATKAVLTDITFRVAKGSIFGVLGPNGAGKTTLLRILLGLIAPDSGEALVLGNNPMNACRDIKREFGFVLEAHGFNQRLSAFQNLDFFAQVYGLERDKRKQKILDMLERVELSPFANQKVGHYSTGMKQRLSLARALLHQPKVLFLDEPTSNLDPEGTVYIRNAIRDLSRNEGITVFMNSHDLDEVERICSHIAIIDHGQLVAQGSVEEFLRPKDQLTLEIKLEESFSVPVLSDLINSLTFVDHFEISGNTVKIALAGDTSRNELISRLSSKGIPIREITEVRNHIEDAYLSLMEREKIGEK